ncbi:MAG TPA: hypothetical protein VEI07_02125 [Planctomycetaceae bacterium]|nr:hypothetical protein [Planctomycetaceae bacterium]
MGTVLCAIAIASFASLATRVSAADVKGGIEGKVVKADAAKGTITIISQGNEKTYNVAAATVIVGPRGGIVRRRLHDPRFHEGLPITVVANGDTATQLVLGVDHKAAKSTEGTAAKGATNRASGFRGEGAAKSEEAADDEDNEYPGKIKSVDADKNLLVVTLLTGKDRSFMVGSEAKLTIRGRVSQKGLSDAALRPGASVTVATEEGSKKVKEVRLEGAVGRGGRRPMRLGRPSGQ